MYNEFDPKHYKGKWPCTTKTLYNEKTLIGRLHQYFLIYFETFSVPTADTLFLLILSILTLPHIFTGNTRVWQKFPSAIRLLLSVTPEYTGAIFFHTVLVCLVHTCIPSQGTPSPLAPSQAASAISCMVSRILTPPGRHHSGVSLLIRRFAQKAIATAMFQCKPLFLFILGPIVLGLIRNPIWQDSGGLASSFNFQSIESAFWSEFLICSLLSF